MSLAYRTFGVLWYHIIRSGETQSIIQTGRNATGISYFCLYKLKKHRDTHGWQFSTAQPVNYSAANCQFSRTYVFIQLSSGMN
jgi:hypothetical protein